MRRVIDRFRLRLRSIFRRGAADASLARELALHLDELTREHVARGLDPAAARDLARREFGSVALIEEQCRDTRRVAPVHNLAQDARLALRSLVRQPLLVIAAAVSIGAGVGANLLVVGLARELLMAPPDARAPHRLVNVRVAGGSHVSHTEWRALEASGALEGLAGYNVEVSVNWRDRGRTTAIAPLIVTGNFFDVLGVPMALGRGFGAVEADAWREPRVAVVSHAFWRQRLGGDPGVLGRTLTVNGQDYALVGVMAEGARSIVGFGLAPEIYLPQSRSLTPDLDHPEGASVQLVGRLREDQEPAQGVAALNTVLQRGDRPGVARRVTMFAPVTDGLPDLGSMRVFSAVLLVLSALVLAIACANVAGLNLARATVRRREIAVRLALGASRARLVQQLLVESLWLAVAGAAAGLLLMTVALQLLSRIVLPIPVPLELRATFDPFLTAYAVALVLLATIFSGLAPALRATRQSLVPALRQDEPRYFHRRWTLRSLLVTGQVAVSMVLLVTAVLFARNLARTHAAEPGFETSGTYVAEVGLVEGRHTREGRTQLLAQAARELSARPGVEAASFALGVPLTIRHGRTSGARIRLEGQDESQAVEARWAENMVGPGYFETLRIPVRLGRGFDDRDGPEAPRVVVVSERFVRRYLGGAPPLGLRVLLPGAGDLDAYEIVGVAADTRHQTLGEEPMAAVYYSYAQRPGSGRFAHVLARTPLPADTALPSMAAAIGALDPTAAVEVRTMDDMLAFAFLPSRVGALLLGGLGLIGLTLALGGLFALLSYTVTRRTREIGLRIALGATGAGVARLVARDGAVLVATGVAIGLGISAFATEPLSMFLVTGLSPTDPVSFAATTLLFFMAGAAATWLPVRRALRVDPVVALREE